MRNAILTITAILLGFAAQAQLIRYGFRAPVYDNFNNADPDAAFEVIVLIPNNDTLRTTVGSRVSPIDGSAVNGVHFSFSDQNFLFTPGTTNWNGSNVKRFPINITPDPVYWGKRSFLIKLSNFVGIVPADQLLNQQDELVIIIDYDGSSLGLPRLTIHDYALFPIPATEKLNISGVDAEQYYITDLMGRTIQEGVVFNNTVDVYNLNKGIYIFNAKTKQGIIMHKFIKE